MAWLRTASGRRDSAFRHSSRRMLSAGAAPAPTTRRWVNAQRLVSGGTPVTTLVLPVRERLRLHDRAYRAQQRDQSEVCGAVVADPTGRCSLLFLPNQSNR